jgi:hypothetical protein
MEWSEAHKYIFYSSSTGRVFVLDHYNEANGTIDYAFCPVEWLVHPSLIDRSTLQWNKWDQPQRYNECLCSNPRLIPGHTEAAPQDALFKKIRLLEARFKRNQERKQNEMGRCI